MTSVERINSMQINYQSFPWYQEVKLIAYLCVVKISKEVQKN